MPKQENLKIQIVHTGKQYMYDEDFETDYPIYGQVVESIVLKQDNQSFNLRDLIPKEIMLLGPTENDACYDPDQGLIIFRDLANKGNILELLHEIGHAEVNKRYPYLEEEDFVDSLEEYRKKSLENDVKRERHAWGYALTKLKQLREMGLNIEPGFDNKEIKKFIRDSLLSHEIFEKITSFYRECPQEELQGVNYWQSASQDYIMGYIDQIFEDANFHISDEEISREIVKDWFKPR